MKRRYYPKCKSYTKKEFKRGHSGLTMNSKLNLIGMTTVRKTRVITSVQEMREAIERTLCDVEAFHFVTEEKRFDIKLALNELIANSLEHTEHHYAKLMYEVGEHFFKACVLDKGQGFCLEKCRCSESFSEAGRGVFLVKCVSDSVRYNKTGNVVVVKINF